MPARDLQDDKDKPARQIPRAATPQNTAPQLAVRRVLFVCIGNSCRSQMAEGFAKKYGADVLLARSAGLSPAVMIAPLTVQTMAEHNISLEDQFPKLLDMTNRDRNDLVINISGELLLMRGLPVIDWDVRDPIGESPEVFRAVASEIEALVMRLILDLRNGAL